MLRKTYKVRISKEVAESRAKKAWETRRKNGTTTPWNKGKKGLQSAWNKGLDKSDSRVLQYSISVAKIIRKQFQNGRKQYTHTPEINAKMGAAKMGDKNPMRMYPELRNNSRRVVLLRLQKDKKPPTDIEAILYDALKTLGVEYYTYVIVEEKTIPDAYIPSIKTVIYADGTYWHQMPGRPELDSAQNRLLSNLGYNVLRFNDKQIKAKGFLKDLAKKLKQIKRSKFSL